MSRYIKKNILFSGFYLIFLSPLLVLRFFLEYQWLIDFAVYATGVFLFTECYYSVVDASKEVNLGAIWCVLTVLFCLYPSPEWSIRLSPQSSDRFFLHFSFP